MRRLLPVLVVLALGCDETTTPADAAVDGSATTMDAAPHDAGEGADAGGDTDAGADPDAGSDTDAGADPDAGTSARGLPDPMLLLEADEQRAADDAPAVAAGDSYLDPTSGVRVWRVTGPETPTSNSEGHHDYGNGPTQISGRLDDAGTHTLLVYLAGVGHRLVDFTPGDGFSSWRAPAVTPRSDLSFTFSKNPATPHLAYVVDGSGELHRVDTVANTTMDGDGFPVSGFGGWLQQDRHDEQFVALRASGGGVVAWNAATLERLERTFADLDEPYLEHEGRTVLVNTGGTDDPPLWDLEDDEVRTVSSPTRIFHSASLRGFWTAADVDVGGGSVPYYRVGASSGAAEEVLDFDGYQSNFHMAGQWIQGDLDAPPGTDQWVLVSMYGGYQSGGPLVDRSLGFFRLDGVGGFRFLAHSYTSSGADYWQTPRATISPDGELVMFDSNRGTGRGDVFLVEVPLGAP